MTRRTHWRNPYVERVTPHRPRLVLLSDDIVQWMNRRMDENRYHEHMDTVPTVITEDDLMRGYGVRTLTDASETL